MTNASSSTEPSTSHIRLVSPRPIRAATTALSHTTDHEHDLSHELLPPLLPSPGFKRRKSVAFSNQCTLIPRTYKSVASRLREHVEDVPIAVDESRLFRNLLQRGVDDREQLYEGDRVKPLLSGYSRAKASWSDGDLPNFASSEESVPVEEDYFSLQQVLPRRSISHLIRRTESPQLVTKKSALKRPPSRLGKERLSVAAIRSGVLAKQQQQQHTPASPTFASPPMASPTFASPSMASPAMVAPSPVAAPRASYRPLRLGGGDSDEEEELADEIGKATEEAPRPLPSPSLRSPASPIPQAPLRLSSPHPYPRRQASSSERVPTSGGDEAGPPVIQVDKASILLGPPLAQGGRRAATPLHFCQHEDGLHSCPDLSLLVCPSPLPVTRQPNASRDPSPCTERVNEAPKLSRAPSLSGNWLRRRAKRISDHWVTPVSTTPVMATSTSSGSLSEWQHVQVPVGGGEEDPSEEQEPLRLVPLRKDCVCQHCSGRISAGQSSHYVPHWSRGARAKWLADRKQAELAATDNIASDRLKFKVMSSTTEGEELRNTRFNARSPPPRTIPSPTIGMRSLGSDEPAVHSPLTERTSAILETATREGEGVEESEAGDDLRRILLQTHLQHDVARAQQPQPPAVQVDEMDQMKDETRYPSEMGSMTNDQLVAAARELQGNRPSPANLRVPPRWGSPAAAAPSPSSSPAPGALPPSTSPVPWRSASPLSSPALQHVTNGAFHFEPPPLPSQVPERRPTPLGVTEEETIPDLDHSLSAQVDSVLAARQERQRLSRARKRGGARGMMAQLEEAEAEAELSRLKREKAQSETQNHGITRRHSTVGVGYQRPSLRSPSPSAPVPATATQAPAVRPSSPFMEKLKGKFRRSSSSHKYEAPTQPPSQPQSQTLRHHRSLSYGGHGGRNADSMNEPLPLPPSQPQPDSHRKPVRSRSDGHAVPG